MLAFFECLAPKALITLLSLPTTFLLGCFAAAFASRAAMIITGAFCCWLSACCQLQLWDVPDPQPEYLSELLKATSSQFRSVLALSMLLAPDD
ncbi:MAG: hypothetical protein IPJ38_09390 [Dechloromonas sp.]|uniref:Uncharacterized protein n=1 Tax=Candidatus Dechloromonas phosphorivorans TaxID=2899244 RepID=A0A935K2L8_9RHOO|nr:hypothetical protein [Candidatus Dechloromonas phosphorivorans]